MQTPPAYSAIKINGQRAYKLARAGKEVVLEPRPVRIDSIQLTDYAYPFVRFTAHVSSGTYIRSLVEDIGKELGTGAYMSDLRRTKVGQFDIAHATPVTGVTIENIKTLVLTPE
jgi:tRNA pseudouridine55 synthase